MNLSFTVLCFFILSFLSLKGYALFSDVPQGLIHFSFSYAHVTQRENRFHDQDERIH